MRQPRLVACDVDGTLLGPTERASARTRAAVVRVLASGTPFVLATGRPPRWIPMLTEELPGVTTAVCANGAVRYDIAADRVRSVVTLRPDELVALARACDEALPGARLGVERAGRTAFDAPFLFDEGYRPVWTNSDQGEVPRAELFDSPAIKLLVRHPEMTSDAMLAALAPLVGDTVALTFSSSKGLVEAAPAGVTKASGLAEVAEFAGVPAKDVIAFGDMPNDIPMLDWAGHGVAMGNAHVDVLAAADEVTATNGEDGVALVLERWF